MYRTGRNIYASGTELAKNMLQVRAGESRYAPGKGWPTQMSSGQGLAKTIIQGQGWPKQICFRYKASQKHAPGKGLLK